MNKIISNYVGFLLILGAYLFLIFDSNFTISSDGAVRYSALVSLMEEGIYPKIKFSMISSLFSVPLYLINPEYTQYLNILVLSITLFLSWKILTKHFGGHDFAIKFTLLILSASMFTNYIRDYWSEVFSASFLFLGILYFIIEDKKIIGIAFITLAVANNPALLMPVGCMMLYLALSRKKISYLFMLFFPIILIILENYLKYGTLMNEGYSDDHGYKTVLPYSGLPGFSYPFILGVISILFSFGKGLIFFTSGFFISPRRSENINLNIFFNSVIIIAIGLIIIYSKWWAWYGGVSFGPRFFLFISIISSVFIAYYLSELKQLSNKKFILLLLVIFMSFYVGFIGHIDTGSYASFGVKDSYALESFTWYVPEYSALIYPFIFDEIIINNIHYLVFDVVVYIYIVKDVVKLQYLKFKTKEKLNEL